MWREHNNIAMLLFYCASRNNTQRHECVKGCVCVCVMQEQERQQNDSRRHEFETHSYIHIDNIL